MINNIFENKIFSKYKMARNINNFKNDGNKKKKLILSKLNVKLNVNGMFSVDDKIKLGLKKDAKNAVVYDKLRDKYNKKLDEERRTINKQKRIDKAKEKKQILKNTTTIKNPTKSRVYEALKGKGGNYTLALIENGKVIRSKNYFGAVGHDFMNTLVLDWLISTPEYYWWDDYPDARLVIYSASQFTPLRVAQSFKQGITNCMFKPIIDHFTLLRDKAQTDATYKKHYSKVNVCKKLELEYRSSGVGEKDVHSIVDKLGINININQPFQKKYIEARSGTKARNTFNFINTKVNHVDLNEITNEKGEELPFAALQNLWEELKLKNIWHSFTRNNWGISSIMTTDKKYILQNDYSDCIKEFEEDTGLNCCYIDDVDNYELSQFVRNGCHFNSTVDFKPLYKYLEEDDGEPLFEDGYKHMDMKGAYKGFKQCKFYKGFLGKITDFRQCNKIVKHWENETVEVGMYKIKNIKLTGDLKLLNDKMHIYKEGINYPSPELEMLLAKGCTFDIVEGCWGSKIDFEFDADYWNEEADIRYPQLKNTFINRDNNKWQDFAARLKKGKGIRYYCKYVGTMFHHSEYKKYYISGDKEYLQNIAAMTDYDAHNYYEGNEELQVCYKKKHNNHLSHVCAFITSYMRMNVLEQLLSMKVDDILRVCCDGIYYYGDYKCLNVFRDKPDVIKDNVAGDSYISQWYENNDIENKAKFREHYMTELHKGVGGGGKTYYNLTDKGLCRVLYIAPSWKLARVKKDEHCIDAEVWFSMLLGNDKMKNQYKKRYNVLIFDEVSMMSEQQKKDIIEFYGDLCKLIFCGDIGYQLPPFSKDGKEVIEFTEKDMDYIQEHNDNYRIDEGDPLLQHLQTIRDNINVKGFAREYALKVFDKISKIEDYKVEDMILVPTCKLRDAYSLEYEALDKWYVETKNSNYSRGDIIIGDKPDIKCKKRHAFTVHSIQGETANSTLYIDISKMFRNRIIYTALSRARRISQIKILRYNIDESC